ncbi:cyclin-dependent kinase 9-like [Copidosoma floridanum]|uniref:cyclin-dependent kinase 9-like n=1 Tax=Copidosoma floridanum TaxID=29053 RepID=UPI000C6F4BD6|nr:cyclin-dependent kinase 9-like [Copidosoma floridanum]
MVFNPELLFSMGEIKATFKQILDGLSYIHARKVLHRDLKGSNVLVNVRGVVKITDFGLARDTWADCRLTNKVVSHWYKAPELLLGDTSYGAGIDMWSAGCMLAEMVVRHPLFLGQTDQAVLYLISDLCGSITTEV